MKVVYTKHAERKFEFVAQLKWNLNKNNITHAIQYPDFHSIDEEEHVETVLKEFDTTRNLRVIFSKNNDIITVITFYLTKKGRYENG